MGYFIVCRLKKDRTDLIAFGLIWFLVTILPRSSIIPSTELVADYKTYAASMGILFLIAAAFVAVVEYLYKHLMHYHIKLWHKYAVQLDPSCLSVVLPLSATKYGDGGRILVECFIQNAPNKARAYNNYGVSIITKKSQFHQAINYFKKAITMDRYYPDPCNNLAVVFCP